MLLLLEFCFYRTTRGLGLGVQLTVPHSELVLLQRELPRLPPRRRLQSHARNCSWQNECSCRCTISIHHSIEMVPCAARRIACFMLSFPIQLKMQTINRSTVSVVHQHTCGSVRDASCQGCKTSSFMNSNRTLRLESLPVRGLGVALPCRQYLVTAAISITVAIRAVVTVVVTATVAVIPVVVVVDADFGAGVAVAVDVCAKCCSNCSTLPARCRGTAKLVSATPSKSSLCLRVARKPT